MRSILMKDLDKFTMLSEEEQQAVIDDICIVEYKRGTILLRQGDIPTKCYFVLKGCIRQFSIDEAGKETTSNFYTEEQAVSIFNYYRQDRSSPRGHIFHGKVCVNWFLFALEYGRTDTGCL